MTTLIGLLLLASLIALAVGLINPTWVRLESRGRVATIFGIAFLVLSVLAALTSPSSNDTQTNVLTQKPTGESAPTPYIASSSQTSSPPQTDQQKLESVVRSQLGGTGIKVTFRDANIDKDDTVRPVESNFVTIDLNLGDFWDENQLTNESGTMVSNIIQKVYSINPHFYDVLVFFLRPYKGRIWK